MTSHGKTEWADRLIPNLDQSATADLISRLCDFAFIISSDGEITQTVTSPFLAPKLDLTPWTGLQFKDTLTKESVPKFEARLAEFQRGQKEVRPVELNHRATDQQAQLPVRYTYHSGAADGSTLLLGSDLRPVAEMQQQLVEAQIALENDYDARREHEIRLRVLMDSSDVATVFITLETGAIVSCNSAAEILLGRPRNELIDASFASEFEDEDLTSLIDRMVTAASDASMGAILAKSALGGRSYRIDPTLFRGATSQMLLCKIEPEEPAQEPVDQLATHLVSFFHKGVDPIVFVNMSGQILSVNEAFVSLANVTHAQTLSGRSMSEFFSRGSVDLNVILESARRNGKMRLYSTKVLNEHGDERPVEISTTQIRTEREPICVLLLRNARRVEAISTPTSQMSEAEINSVVELIGSQSLKDIVARSTDVVEKMCIETAIGMTSNNRVAAAEMLGLSRQSLYVKLRKYDLV
ncbi:transcriptional regulator PpsR [Planktomarina temperata]|nr:transcriptional regulator PpsR [Planktomarina temperata]